MLAMVLTVVLSVPVAALAMWLSRGEQDGLGFGVAIIFAAVLTALTGMLDIAAYWRSRRGRFAASAGNGLVRSVATGVMQVGLASSGGFGLIAGTVIGTALATVTAGIDIVRRSEPMLRLPKARRIVEVGILFKSFPLFSVPQGLVAALSWNAMPLLLMRFAGAAAAGQYWVAYRVLVAPLTLFNAAYRQSALSQLRCGEFAEARKLAAYHTLLIAAVGILPTLLLHWLGPLLFSILMGSHWQLAGAIAGWMILGVLADFFKVPLQCLMQSRMLQHRILLWEVAVFVVRYAAALPFLVDGENLRAVAAFSGVGLAGWVSFVLVELMRTAPDDK
jgi:O-antigen/teichoic acid export membrane protein